MSMNRDLPAGMEETRTYQFSAPSALNVNVLGQDNKTLQRFFNLSTINSMLRMIENLTSSSTLFFEYDLLKNGYVVRTLTSQQMRADLQGPTWVGFPLNLGPGQYQIQMRQTGGTLITSTQEIQVIWQTALVMVGR